MTDGDQIMNSGRLRILIPPHVNLPPSPCPAKIWNRIQSFPKDPSPSTCWAWHISSPSRSATECLTAHLLTARALPDKMACFTNNSFVCRNLTHGILQAVDLLTLLWLHYKHPAGNDFLFSNKAAALMSKTDGYSVQWVRLGDGIGEGKEGGGKGTGHCFRGWSLRCVEI